MKERHEASVHRRDTAAKCPQCGFSSSRYHTGNIISYVMSREDELPPHFERVHTGRFRANGKLSICSRCGKIDSCNCTANNEELSPREMERRVRDQVRDLGFDRETRRYCWTLFKITMSNEFFLCTYFQFELH